MSRTTEFLVSITCLVLLVVAGIYIGQHVHYGCLFGNCVAVIK
jgi:hypothetical protein